MGQTIHLFRIDIGLDPDRGYGCTVVDVPLGRMKGIRGNSIEQLLSRLRNVIREEAHHKRDFPLESESSSGIILPNGHD